MRQQIHLPRLSFRGPFSNKKSGPEAGLLSAWFYCACKTFLTAEKSWLGKFTKY